MGDDALHALARVLLHLCSPRRAHAILTRIGDFLPAHREPAAIKRVASRLRPRGTCLSRALTLAARIPDAEVVIGVAPRVGQKLLAHAWLERFGEDIDPSNVEVAEIARLVRAERPRAKNCRSVPL